MAKIPKKMRWIYDLLLTAAILAMATVLCTLLRRIDDGSGYVNLIFVLAVATISRWTEGYFWGIFSAVSGVLLVNYVFTYPYWEFNFTITGYPFTFLAMLTVSMMISAMNTQIKKQERLRIETEKEAVRANLLRAMSHDIRTPLTSIVGNTAAILENEDSVFSRAEAPPFGRRERGRAVAHPHGRKSPVHYAHERRTGKDRKGL